MVPKICFSKCLQYTAFKGCFIQRAYQKEGNKDVISTENLKVLFFANEKNANQEHGILLKNMY